VSGADRMLIAGAMATPNEYGVFAEPTEVLRLADEWPKRHMVIELVRCRDGWRYAYELQWGGTSLGAGGRHRPAKERDPAHPYRDDALRAAKAELRGMLRDALRPCWSRSPGVRRDIEELLALIPEVEQLSLFGSATRNTRVCRE